MVENFACGEISERSFSKPHPWSVILYIFAVEKWCFNNDARLRFHAILFFAFAEQYEPGEKLRHRYVFKLDTRIKQGEFYL